MTAELTQEVCDKLESDRYGWLTTVAKSGQPVPRLVWFYFDGNEVTIYSEPNAAKVKHIRARPRVSLGLDSDGNGSGVVIVGGEAWVDAVDADPLADQQYNAKYGEYAASLGFSEEFLATYQHPVEDQHRQGVDHADGRVVASLRACVKCHTARRLWHAHWPLRFQRKSRDFEPMTSSMRPNRSATTVTAPVAFCS